jgi:hypothetical protein
MDQAGARRDATPVHAPLLRQACKEFGHCRLNSVTDKEFIDLFQDGLYHFRTFEDFGHCFLSSVTKLKDMITS